MRPVTVLILHPPAPPDASEAVRWLVEARERIAERHRSLFEAAGAETVRIVTDDPVQPISFGERLRGLAREIADATPRGRRHGLVLIGSGAMPLARQSDLEDFVRVARSVARRPVALANSYYSADAIALPDVGIVASVPDLPSDNALPRWLAERAGIPVRDRRDVWRLGVDIDSPLDVLLVAGDPDCPRRCERSRVRSRRPPRTSSRRSEPSPRPSRTAAPSCCSPADPRPGPSTGSSNGLRAACGR